MIRLVASPIEPVRIDTPGACVYEQFKREPETLAIAVLDLAGAPVGLIERNAFFLKMGAEFGRALFAKRPASAVMDPCPIIVDAATPLDTFLAEALSGSPSQLLKGFVVVEQGGYFGVGTALNLLIAASAENVRRAGELEAIAEERLVSRRRAERARNRLSKAVEALGRARDAAEAANRAKSEFLANMSHEIRTPLNGVLGVAGALGRTPLNERQRSMVTLIEDSAASLQVLLSDILDLARVEAHELEVASEPFRPAEAAQAVAELFRSKAEEKGLAFQVQISREAGQAFLGDSVRVKQILGNLISNAVKFTETGEIALALEIAHSGDGAQTLRFTVRDTGIGFDEAFAERIFTRFQQADGSVTRRFGGAGLGLSISHALADLMAGRLSAASTPGAGSVFTLELPAIASREPAAGEREGGTPPAPAADRRTTRILVAEDHPVNRKVVELIFDGLDVELTMAEDGEAALDCFRRSGADLILMDMQMPRMDGLVATQAIRDLEARRGTTATPIIMLTANALPEHEDAGRGAGADFFLTKPISAGALLAAIDKALAGTARNAVPPPDCGRLDRVA